MRDYLFNTNKIKYVKGQKPKVDCILCAIRDKNPEVVNYEIIRSELSLVTVNLYPFNPGHLLIFPLRHVVNFQDLTDEEAMDIHRLTVKTIEILNDEFSPSGYNMGYNLGSGSGASIAHIHQQIVPRYENEIGFIDVLSGTRVFVVDPAEVMARLKKRFV